MATALCHASAASILAHACARSSIVGETLCQVSPSARCATTSTPARRVALSSSASVASTSGSGLRMPAGVRQQRGRGSNTCRAVSTNDKATEQAPPVFDPDRKRHRKSIEELWRIDVERQISEKRKKELRIDKWEYWETIAGNEYWTWEVTQEVYVAKGVIRFYPLDREDDFEELKIRLKLQGEEVKHPTFDPERCAEFRAGDFVRFPKWLMGDLNYQTDAAIFYRFRAYGDY